MQNILSKDKLSTNIVLKRAVKSTPKNLIELYKSFGGSPSHNNLIIKVITEGGIVGNEMMIVDPSLQLEMFETGIFFLKKSSITQYDPLGGPQGFVKYEPNSKLAHDVFHTYASIDRELYAQIKAIKNVEDFTKFRDRPVFEISLENREIAAITSFNPTTITAGTNDTLTIMGSGFGTSFINQAAVLFANANDGGSSFAAVDTSGNLPTYIINWSDGQIQVVVPKKAGNGIIGVRSSTGTTFMSATSLNVTFSQSDLVTGGTVNEPHFFDHNGSGGYTFLHSTSTDNGGVAIASDDSAMARIDEALAEWKCATGINWKALGTTTIDSSASDGFNVLSYDNDANTTLPNGVLGSTYSFFNTCNPSQGWLKTEMDMILRRDNTGGTNWYSEFDPMGIMPGEVDFKSVVLHEFGHAHGLGHIINPGALMHYAINVGTTIRDFNIQSDIGGGKHVIDHSVNWTNPSCGESLMLPEVCDIADITFSCSDNTLVNFTDTTTGSQYSWRWFFGDGDSSHVQNPQHIYAYPGCYVVKLIATNAFGSDTLIKSDFIAITNGMENPVCPGGTTDNLSNFFGFGIYNFTFNGISKISGGSVNDFDRGRTPNGFIDWSCRTTQKVCLDSTYSFGVTVGNANPEDLHVYFDFNGNGNFTDSGELVFSEVGVNGLRSGNLNISSSAFVDSLLRIRIISDWAGNAISGPCYSPEYGQVEDYSFIVSDCSGTHTWTGNQNDNFANAANWTPNRVPGTGHDVVIPAGVINFPKVYSLCDDIKSLKIETGAQMTISPSGKLEVKE